MDWSRTRITTDVDFDSPGRHIGDLRLKYSDNVTPLGYVPIPVGVLVGKPGPTLLLTAGVHGDEYEGPVAIMKLLHRLDPESLRGRIIMLPALNAPALKSSARVSPLDDGNLNRSFPGDRDGGPTAAIAHMVEQVIMPACDAAIDFHSGGKASWFAPSALAARTPDGSLSQDNMALARVFGAPLIWVLGAHNDDRSVNAAATRVGIPMIATELGGGGQVSRDALSIGEQGLENVLRHLGMVDGEPQPAPAPRVVEIRQTAQHVYAPCAGLFEPAFDPGDTVEDSDRVGTLYSIDEPERAPVEVSFPLAGVAFARGHRGLVARGDLLALVGVDIAD